MISNLPVARLATALVRPMGVDTQLLANVLASNALVQVPTSGVVGIQQESGGTAARVAAFQILTRHFARRRIEQTFVDVCDTLTRVTHTREIINELRFKNILSKLKSKQDLIKIHNGNDRYNITRQRRICLPLQCVPVWSTLNALLQLHLYDPSVFIHLPLAHKSGKVSHSFMSVTYKLDLYITY